MHDMECKIQDADRRAAQAEEKVSNTNKEAK